MKDLVDLVTSMLNEKVDANKLSRLIAVECRLRQIEGIERLSVPESWRSTLSGNYAKLAKEAALPSEFLDVEGAEAAVSTWPSPVFGDDGFNRTWIPKEQRWA